MNQNGMRSETGFTTFLDEMKWRGFFEQCSDEDALYDLLSAETVTGYIGFDPTADSLHVGSLLPIMGLVHLQRHGHRPIAIVGGATAMVGDPTGRTELRRMLTLEKIEENLLGIKGQLGHYLRFGDGLQDGLMLNNADWLKDFGYLEFLREFGHHFSVNQMLARDSVKSRMEHGLSFIEFNYMLLQAFDFMVLNRDHGCKLQMGGSDQWGNICSGIDLARRVNRQEVFGLTFPLMMTAAGTKMGKSAGGAVWLAAERTSVHDFYQYWINVDDRDVARFLRLYTLLPPESIEKLESLTGADIREAKRVLAHEVTAMLHGDAAATEAAEAAQALFGGGGGGDAEGIPGSERPLADFDGDGVTLIDTLVDSGLLGSKGEARRMIRQKAVRINGEVIVDEMRSLTADDISDGRIALQVGKKRHHHLIITGAG